MLNSSSLASNAYMPSLWHLAEPTARKVGGELWQNVWLVDTARSPSLTGFRHQHHCVEVIVVHAGALILSFGGSVRVLTADDAVVFYGSTVHGGRAVDGYYTRTVLHYVPREESFAAPGPSPAQPYFAMLPRGYKSEFLKSVRTFHTHKAQMSANISVEDLLAQTLLPLQPVVQPSGAALHPVVQQAINYMVQQVNSGESVDDLAWRFHVSPSNFYQLFQDELNCSPHRLWLLVKIEQACNNAVLDRANVDTLADTTGFASRRGFERAFQRVTGMSVSAYRHRVLMKITG